MSCHKMCYKIGFSTSFPLTIDLVVVGGWGSMEVKRLTASDEKVLA